MQTFSPSRLFTGAPKLKHIIPLVPSRTKISLFSSPDLIFCLTHRPTPSSLTSAARGGESPPSEPDGSRKASKRGYVHFRHAGTNIFTLRAKTSQTAKAWMWALHLALGGAVPRVLDIAVPGLGARISLPVPADLPPPPAGEHTRKTGYVNVGEGEGWRLCTPDAVVKACVSQLATVLDWKELVERCEQDGVQLRLAWRRGEILEWVETGKQARDWSVVVGWILRQVHLILESVAQDVDSCRCSRTWKYHSSSDLRCTTRPPSHWQARQPRRRSGSRNRPASRATSLATSLPARSNGSTVSLKL